jgi:hypothetical protein
VGEEGLSVFEQAVQDAVIAMLFAVFLASDEAQKHNQAGSFWHGSPRSTPRVTVEEKLNRWINS